MIRPLLTIALALATGAAAIPALAKLPPPDEAQKAKADLAKARAAWSDKVAAFQLCRAQDRVAAHYLADMKSKGKTVAPAAAAPCNDPGPFVDPATASAPKATEPAAPAAGKTAAR